MINDDIRLVSKAYVETLGKEKAIDHLELVNGINKERMPKVSNPDQLNEAIKLNSFIIEYIKENY